MAGARGAGGPKGGPPKTSGGPRKPSGGPRKASAGPRKPSGGPPKPTGGPPKPGGRPEARPSGPARGAPLLRATEAFVSVHPGLEKLLAAELTELDVSCEIEEGGVIVPATQRALARIHVGSRIAGRVLVRVGEFRATNLEELAARVKQLPWRALGESGQPVEVEASCQNSRMRFRELVAEKTRLAVIDGLRGPRMSVMPPSKTPLGVHVRLVDDVATVSVDASGERLHMRGWREATAKAPLRENLAAAVLRSAGWRPGMPLVDPMCGAGTFPIEAARQAAGLSPRIGWKYPCANWSDRNPAAWAEAERAIPAAVATPILAADRDPGAVRATTGNAQRAKVGDKLKILTSALEELDPPSAKGLLIANLPYGQRVAEGGDIDGMYARWGHVLRERWSGWRCAFLAADPRKLGRLDRRIEIVLRFENGGTPVVVGVLPQA